MLFYDGQNMKSRESYPSIVEGLHIVETQEGDLSGFDRSSIHQQSTIQSYAADQKYLIQLKEINRDLNTIHIPTFLKKNKQVLN
jgi:hypothetical protein